MFLKDLFNKIRLFNNDLFIWDSKHQKIKNIDAAKLIDINLLIGIDKQKKMLLNNTINFAKGNFTNNALLWGSRGNGKSSLIKAIFFKVNQNNKNLKLLQLNKNNIFDIENIYKKLQKYKNYDFIIL